MGFMDIFKTKEANGPTESHVITEIMQLYGGMPVYSKVDYETMAKEGYGNFILFSSLNHIVNAFNQLEWIVTETDKDGKKSTVKNHPISTLLKRPNPYQGEGAYNEAMIKYLYIGGDTFIHKVHAGDKKDPSELYALKPDKVKVEFGTSADEPITKFEYGSGNTPIDIKDVLHIKLFNPTDIYNGLGRGQSAFNPVSKITDTVNAAMNWNASVMQNGGRPSGAFVSESQLTEDQYDRMKEQMKTNLSGAKNAGKPLLLEGGVTWQEMFINQKDADWVDSTKLIMRQQSTTMGVPSILNGDTESTTYSNYEQARKALYLDTVIPLGNYIREEYNNFFSESLDDNESIEFSTDGILALQEEVSAVFKRANEAVSLSENEKREMMGYDTVEGLDVIVNAQYMYDIAAKKMYVNMNFVPVEDLGMELDDEPVKPDDDNDDDKK